MDEHLATLERELDELRSKREPLGSITDELERIGEQTASILVVAHDQAHETTRLAQEQAERCVADAAANAVAMTEDAKQRLRDLDNETDAIWRERERLLEDVRVVSAALANLADQASDRFPAAEPATPAAAAFPAVGAHAHRAAPGIWEQAAASEPAMPPMRAPARAAGDRALQRARGIRRGRRLADPARRHRELAGGPGAAGPARLIWVSRVRRPAARSPPPRAPR